MKLPHFKHKKIADEYIISIDRIYLQANAVCLS